MIEKLDLNSEYSPEEAAIHVSRYMVAKEYCKNRNVLDIACGEGYGSYLLKIWGASSVDGVDIAEDSIEKAKKLFKCDSLNYFAYNAEEIDKKMNKKYDLIVSFETIEHLKNPIEFLKSIKNLASEDAIIIISCPNDYLYYPDNTSNPYHIRKYTLTEFQDLVTETLGVPNDILFGFPARGYVNLSKKDSDNSIKNQIDMVKSETISAINLPSKDSLIEDKSCYYIAIWGTNPKNNVAIYQTTLEKEKETQNYIDELKKYHSNYENRQKIIEESLRKENEFMKLNIVYLMNKSEQLDRIIHSRTYKIFKKIKNFIKFILGRK